MKIDFENLGNIRKGSIELNDLTLLCGPNNCGKTYAMYSLYGLLDKEFEINFSFVKKMIGQLKTNGVYSFDVCEIITLHQKDMISDIEKHFKEYLPSLFGVTDDEFFKTTIKLNFDNKELKEEVVKEVINSQISLGKSSDWLFLLEKEKESTKIQCTLRNTEIPDKILQRFISINLTNIVFKGLSKESFLLPAERSGLNLFFRELSSTRNLLLQHAQKDSIDPMELLKDIFESKYADPVNDYIQYLNKIGSWKKEKSIYREFAQDIQKNILKGKYEVDKQSNVFFMPYRSQNKKLPLHFSSSTVKTFFGLVFYLEHRAKKGDCLMIDEPELNLHPDNQRNIARVIAQLVNAGLKVIVSTHSNYFIRELNNLIMLKADFPEKERIKKQFSYKDNELLNSKIISAYLFDGKGIFPMSMDDEGIVVETFDTVTNELNQSSNEIFYAIQDAKESE